MKFVNSDAHHALVVVGYLVQGASLVNEIGLEAVNLGIPLPPWARLAIPAAGLIATRLARLLPTNELKPTPNLNTEDTGAKLGKAAGEASAKASRGPFAVLFLAALSALSACASTQDCRAKSISRPQSYSLDRGQTVHIFGSSAILYYQTMDYDSCQLKEASISDPDSDLRMGPGVVYMQGTGDWGNGLTGYEQPVFVGPWRRGGESGTEGTAIFQ